MNGAERNRILIVEDDLASLFALRALFAHRGWEVSVARCVEDALAALDGSFDWIIVDLGLADGDGEEVIAAARSAGLGARLAVTSGILDPDRAGRLLEMHVDFLMSKPIEFNRLYAVCSGVLPMPRPSELFDYSTKAHHQAIYESARPGFTAAG